MHQYHKFGVIIPLQLVFIIPIFGSFDGFSKYHYYWYCNYQELTVIGIMIYSKHLMNQGSPPRFRNTFDKVTPSQITAEMTSLRPLLTENEYYQHLMMSMHHQTYSSATHLPSNTPYIQHTAC